jgi:hypothetical protein
MAISRFPLTQSRFLAYAAATVLAAATCHESTSSAPHPPPEGLWVVHAQVYDSTAACGLDIYPLFEGRSMPAPWSGSVTIRFYRMGGVFGQFQRSVDTTFLLVPVDVQFPTPDSMSLVLHGMVPDTLVGSRQLGTLRGTWRCDSRWPATTTIHTVLGPWALIPEFPD